MKFNQPVFCHGRMKDIVEGSLDFRISLSMNHTIAVPAFCFDLVCNLHFPATITKECSAIHTPPDLPRYRAVIALPQGDARWSRHKRGRHDHYKKAQSSVKSHLQCFRAIGSRQPDTRDASTRSFQLHNVSRPEFSGGGCTGRSSVYQDVDRSIPLENAGVASERLRVVVERIMIANQQKVRSINSAVSGGGSSSAHRSFLTLHEIRVMCI